MKKFASSAVLDGMEPGTYHVSDIFNRIVSSGASVATNWVGIKKQLEKKPEWHWNGLSAPGKSAWIKDAPKPKPVSAPIVVVQRVHDDDEPHKGPVFTSLAHIEGMVGTLCEQLGIKLNENEINPNEAVEHICQNALAEVESLFRYYVKGHYITAKKARAIYEVITEALTDCGR
jgi:hypothetical protein